MRNDKSEKIAEHEVPVSTYADNEAQQTVLHVNQAKTIDTTTPMLDVAKQACALEKGIVAKLSPTLKKFTLEGKVALVTG